MIKHIKIYILLFILHIRINFITLEFGLFISNNVNFLFTTKRIMDLKLKKKPKFVKSCLFAFLQAKDSADSSFFWISDLFFWSSVEIFKSTLKV